jgi:acyl-CoA reductase-like NAD-dependent aldehyde dehydrogenase
MNTVTTTDPRSGQTMETAPPGSTAEDVDRAVRAGRDSAAPLRALGRQGRAQLLNGLPGAIDVAASDLGATAGAVRA